MKKIGDTITVDGESVVIEQIYNTPKDRSQFDNRRPELIDVTDDMISKQEALVTVNGVQKRVDTTNL